MSDGCQQERLEATRSETPDEVADAPGTEGAEGEHGGRELGRERHDISIVKEMSFYKISDSLIASDWQLTDQLRRGFEQSFGVTVLWIFGDLLGSVELENFPAVHYRNPRRKIAHDRHRVGDE